MFHTDLQDVPHFNSLRILTRKKYRQIKLQRLQNVQLWETWVVGMSNQLFMKGS